MLFCHSLVLVLSLRMLKCAEYEVEEEKESFDVEAERELGSSSSDAVMQPACITHEPSERGIMSLLPNRYLLQNIFEYASRSPDLLAMTSKTLFQYVNDEESKKLRFYEGLHWDMPEIAEMKFSLSETMTAEMKLITDLKDVASEQEFNDRIFGYLIAGSNFRELARPVLKYLIRVLLKLQAGKKYFSKEQVAKRTILIDYAAKNSFYDVVHDFKTRIDPFMKMNSHHNLHVYIHEVMDSYRYYDYYSWVYSNPMAHANALKIMRIAKEEGIRAAGLYERDIYAWYSVCIHNRAPESYYFGLTRRSDHPDFFEILKEYLVKFSLITRDVDEMESMREYLMNLNDNLVEYSRNYTGEFRFIVRLINVRFGPQDAEIYEREFIDAEKSKSAVAELLMAASKANKKELVQKLSNHRNFEFSGGLDDPTNPHSFKVLFDIIETNTDRTLNDNIFGDAHRKLFKSLLDEKFKTKRTLNWRNDIQFEIESPAEYVKLGFAENYLFTMERNNAEKFDRWHLQARE